MDVLIKDFLLVTILFKNGLAVNQMVVTQEKLIVLRNAMIKVGAHRNGTISLAHEKLVLFVRKGLVMIEHKY